MKYSVLPVLRAVVIVSIVVTLAVGATVAMDESDTAFMDNNSFSTASVGLDVSTDGTNFSGNTSGFNIEDIIPGGDGEPSGGQTFWLRNDGTVSFGLKVGVDPAVVNAVVPSGSIDLSQVILEFERAGAASTVEHPLQDLIDSFATGGLTLNESLPEDGTPIEFSVKVKVGYDALDGAGGTLSNLNIVFFGSNSLT